MLYKAIKNISCERPIIASRPDYVYQTTKLLVHFVFLSMVFIFVPSTNFSYLSFCCTDWTLYLNYLIIMVAWLV